MVKNTAEPIIPGEVVGLRCGTPVQAVGVLDCPTLPTK